MCVCVCVCVRGVISVLQGSLAKGSRFIGLWLCEVGSVIITVSVSENANYVLTKPLPYTHNCLNIHYFIYLAELNSVLELYLGCLRQDTLKPSNS